MVTNTPADCAYAAVKTGSTVASIMSGVAAGLIGIGSVIGAPITGGGSLVVGSAAAAGLVGGGAAVGVRAAMGKECQKRGM